MDAPGPFKYTQVTAFYDKAQKGTIPIIFRMDQERNYGAFTINITLNQTSGTGFDYKGQFMTSLDPILTMLTDTYTFNTTINRG